MELTLIDYSGEQLPMGSLSIRCFLLLFFNLHSSLFLFEKFIVSIKLLLSV